MPVVKEDAFTIGGLGEVAVAVADMEAMDG